MNDCDAEHKLWTKEGNTFTAHAVETGISNGTYTEILGGISEGTTVVSDAELGGAAPKAEAPAGGERSPFMPGPPGSDKDKKEQKD